jgi:TatA/E family protein of Tat protein translocase
MIFHPILLFLDVSGGELLVIIIVIFLVFGPNKMPEIARQIGKAMNQMKKATNDISREFTNQTSDLRNELTSVQNQVKEEVNTVSREMNSTRESIRKNLDIGDPETATVEKNTAEPPADQPVVAEIKDTEPLPEVYRQSENAG